MTFNINKSAMALVHHLRYLSCYQLFYHTTDIRSITDRLLALENTHRNPIKTLNLKIKKIQARLNVNRKMTDCRHAQKLIIHISRLMNTFTFKGVIFVLSCIKSLRQELHENTMKWSLFYYVFAMFTVIDVVSLQNGMNYRPRKGIVDLRHFMCISVG